MTTHIIDSEDCAKLLHCTPEQVEELARSGDIPGLKLGRSWLFVRADLLGSLYAPGSPDAVAHDCTCPTIDNGHGTGCGYTSELSPGEPLYWFDFGCPLHGHNKSIAPETRCYEMPNVENHRTEDSEAGRRSGGL